MPTQQPIRDALMEAVRQYPGSSARELSAVLRTRGFPDARKRDINPALYRERANFRNDGGVVPRWSLVTAPTTTRGPSRTTRTTEVRARREEVEQQYQARPTGQPVVAQPVPSQYTPTHILPGHITAERQSRPRPTSWQLDLRPWQDEALTAWYGAGSRGVVEAVTGTGKTHLGLEAVAQMAATGGKSTILVPTVVLQEQWVRKIKEFCPWLGIAQVGGGKSDRPEHADVVVAIVNTAANKTLPMGPAEANLLVADEVHRYGAEQWAVALRPGYDLRLGLTATFERDNDEGIGERLLPYFEKVVMSYGYDRAVPEQIVAPFHLLFLGVSLTAEERDDYERLSRAISRSRQILISAGASPKDLHRKLAKFHAMGGQPRQAVQIYESSTRARRNLLADSKSKTEAVIGLADIVAHSRGAVVFTQTVKSAEHAANELRAQGVVAASVHSKMTMKERRANLIALEDESVRALCAPKILDEGVDIPNIDLGLVLAASRTKRQMIQRLGRVIRKKDDDRWASFLVLYARGTVEDPNEGAHEGFMELVRSSAARESLLDHWDAREVARRLGVDTLVERAVEEFGADEPREVLHSAYQPEAKSLTPVCVDQLTQAAITLTVPEGRPDLSGKLVSAMFWATYTYACDIQIQLAGFPPLSPRHVREMLKLAFRPCDRVQVTFEGKDSQRAAAGMLYALQLLQCPAERRVADPDPSPHPSPEGPRILQRITPDSGLDAPVTSVLGGPPTLITGAALDRVQETGPKGNRATHPTAPYPFPSPRGTNLNTMSGPSEEDAHGNLLTAVLRADDVTEEIAEIARSAADCLPLSEVRWRDFLTDYIDGAGLQDGSRIDLVYEYGSPAAKKIVRIASERRNALRSR